MCLVMLGNLQPAIEYLCNFDRDSIHSSRNYHLGFPLSYQRGAGPMPYFSYTNLWDCSSVWVTLFYHWRTCPGANLPYNSQSWQWKFCVVTSWSTKIWRYYTGRQRHTMFKQIITMWLWLVKLLGSTELIQMALFYPYLQRIWMYSTVYWNILN